MLSSVYMSKANLNNPNQFKDVTCLKILLMRPGSDFDYPVF